MADDQLIELESKTLVLRKNAVDFEPLNLFFEVLLHSEELLITSAEQTAPKDGVVTITGQTSAWGNEPADAELAYQATPPRLRQLTLRKSIAEFAGLSLETFRISDLQLYLHAILPEEGGAGFAKVFREIKGKLHLGQTAIDFKIQNPVASSAMLVEVESELGLKEAAHLFGNPENPEQDLAWLPAELRDRNLLSLRDLKFRISPGEGLTFVSVTLVVDEGHRWPIIPGVSWLAVGGLSMTLDVDYPLQPAYRFPVFSVTGMIQLGEPNTQEGLIAITARWPDFAIHGGLVEGSEIKIGKLMRLSGLSTEGLPWGDDTLAIRKLSFTADPMGDPKRFSFLIAIDDVWSFKIAEQEEFAITELSLFLSYSSDPNVGLGGQFTGKFRIAEIDLFVQATHPSAGAGWQFRGGTAPGTEVLIGKLIEDLGKRLGVADIPDSVKEWKMLNLEIAIDTQAKSFFFTIETKFPVNGKELDAVLTIDLKRGEKDYSSHVSGKITVESMEFDLVFDQDKKATIFLASYQNLAGGKLPIGKLLDAVGAGEKAKSAAGEIEIDIKDALFAYEKQAVAAPAAEPGGDPPAEQSTGKVLFALDIGGGINLSNLPFVGKLFPNDQTLRATFQPLITSGDFDKPVVSAIKRLVPPGGINLPEPENGYKSRFLITGALQIGDKTVPFEQQIGQQIGQQQESAMRGATAPAPAPGAAPPALKKADDVKWFEVNKTLGPVSFARAGVYLSDGILWFLLDASLSAGPLNVALDGLAAGSSLKEFKPQFSLRGMSVDFNQGGIEIGGAFLRVPGQNGEEDEFDGMAVIRAEMFTLSAIGSYTRRQGQASIFIYGVLDYPLGGPAFFFITGVAAGFGYNRDLKMPSIDQVASFPLVSQVVSPPGQARNLEAQLESFRTYFPPDVGQIFLCAGIRFSTFELIDSFALLAVQFGHRFELDLLGLSTLMVPPPEEGGEAGTPLAEIQMALKATFAPDDGFLGIQAQLTPNSFLLSRDCHLTGGFAFFTWFKDGYLGGKAGDFVITLGGYHPAYKKPAHYPDVPRVGFNWQVSTEFSIKGGMYFALTGNALMAGGGLQALWHSGPLKAWFLIGADFLIAWKPYHYDARVYVDIGVSFTFELFGTHTITLELGADLHIWGPEFSGVADLHILIFTITIHFGADASPKPDPLDWGTFRSSFLPADDRICSVMVAGGLVKDGSKDGDLGIVNPKEFKLAINSTIPVKSLGWSGVRLPSQDGKPENLNIHIGSMGITDEGLTSEMEVRIWLDGNLVVDLGEEKNMFQIAPVLKNVPAALWGTDLVPDLNSGELIHDVIAGYEITPHGQSEGGFTREIERQKLSYEVASADQHFRGAQTRPAPYQAAADAKPQIDAVLQSQDAAEQRRRLLQQWGFREDQDVHLRPGYASRLMGNPWVK